MTLPAHLPGFGLGLTEESPDAFPNGLVDYCPSIKTVRELNMIRAMNMVTDKPDWDKKILDKEITDKWRGEVKGQLDFTDKMFDWCIEELKDKAKQLEKESFVVALDGDVCKSDTLISEDTRLKIIEAVKVLEDVPDKYKDWHPGSDDLVLDLVHPSLFPLIYGRSRILEDKLVGLENCLEYAGMGTVIKVPDSRIVVSKDKGNISVPHAWSKKFQWLPAEISLHRNEETGENTSYINNLHPKHADIYHLVEEVIAKSIPMWNQSLLAASTANHTNIRLDWDIEYDFDEDNVPPGVFDEDDDEDTQWDKTEEWKATMREANCVQPDAGDYKPWADRVSGYEGELAINLWEEFKEKGLQVIVKFASIHLTPEKPQYSGGSWHMEGQLNDHICATAIYYYSNENITSSVLDFRQEVDEEESQEWPYEQNVHEFMPQLLGVQNESAALQNIGQVSTQQGRLITFPNTLQHQVKPFELADKTKPGHRKILAVFLVDPHSRVISTANVPPQRRDWWEEALNLDRDNRINRLPPELREMIVERVSDFPIDMEEAKKIRLELMEERKTFVKEHNKGLQENIFFLCEH
ncbi:hypothetical protein ABW19_dt0202263 [Dactylella cylindrospora]|nr:hypothetical protein ABW19_dt0202263 [Dactylella cylindrospora]